MAYPVFPISRQRVPKTSSLKIATTIHSFGGPYEQRIVTELPYGPRPSGMNSGGSYANLYRSGGTLSSPFLDTYVGVNIFSITATKLSYTSSASSQHPSNTRIDNSFQALWTFYVDLFTVRNASGVGIGSQYSPFWFYHILENDALTTWTGETSSGPTANSRGESCTNETGRYLVVCEPNLSVEQLASCIFDIGFSVREVAG